MQKIQQGVQKFQDTRAKYLLTDPALKGIGAFMFDCVKEYKVEEKLNITISPVENGSPVIDHAPIEPTKVRIRGATANVFFYPSSEKFINKIVNANLMANIGLRMLGRFTPKLATQAKQIAVKVAAKALQLDDFIQARIQSTQQLLTLLKGNINTTTHNETMYKILYLSYQEKTIFTELWTPFKVYNNMIITSLNVTESSDNFGVFIYDIELTQVNLATTKFVAFNPNKYKGYTISQANETQDNNITNTKNPSAQQKSAILQGGQVIKKYF